MAALRARIAEERDGRLDVLVNDIWGGDLVKHSTIRLAVSQAADLREYGVTDPDGSQPDFWAYAASAGIEIA